MEQPIFYVYVYLDPRKPGNYTYGEYSFAFEPFYVGKGCNGRAYSHLLPGNSSGANRLFKNKIKKIQCIEGVDPVVVLYKEHLNESSSLSLERVMIESIGRVDLKTGPLCNLTNGGVGGNTLSPENYDVFMEKRRIMFSDPVVHAKMCQSQQNRYSKPEERAKLADGRCCKNITTSVLADPSGVVYTIVNMKQFCKDKNLKPQRMRNVVRGVSKQHKGWHLPS